MPRERERERELDAKRGNYIYVRGDEGEPEPGKMDRSCRFPRRVSFITS